MFKIPKYDENVKIPVFLGTPIGQAETRKGGGLFLE
jgi:hypothetical protein